MLTFSPGDGNQALSGRVNITDDNINEALEYFYVDLRFADPASVPSTVTILEENSVIRCDIVDNDGR